MKTKYLLLLISIFFIASCTHDKNSSETKDVSIQDVDLTGTWLFTRTEEIYEKSSGQYLYTNYKKYTYILEETEAGVKYEECWEVGGDSLTGSKNDTDFYMDVNDPGFKLSSPDLLVRELDDEESEDLSKTIKVGESLQKISSDAQIDSGSFSINGENVSASENNWVCSYNSYNTLRTRNSVLVVVPYLDSRLELSFSFKDSLSVASYEFQESSSDSQIFQFDVSSNATEFGEKVGSNALAPASANIDITQVENGFLAGRFSFVGQDSEAYTGNFNIQLP